jgi:hypothetical protein
MRLPSVQGRIYRVSLPNFPVAGINEYRNGITS